MSVSIPQFWKLLIESRLASAEQAKQLQAMFAQVKGGDQSTANGVTLAQWMTSNGLLSLYQAKVLLAGRAGPFVFGDYLLYDRFDGAHFKGIFRGVNLHDRSRVLMAFHNGPMVQIPRQWANLLRQTVTYSKALHPHLSRVLELRDMGPYKFTVLEDLQGQSAEERLAAGPIPWQEAVRIGYQLALGLARMDELELVHGDIRPTNVWLDLEGNAKLLAPPLSRDPSVTPGPVDFIQPDPSERSTTLANNAAPELAEPTYPPDMRSDIYALGCTIYHLIAKHPPFAGDDVLEILAHHAAGEVAAPLEVFGVPPGAAEVVMRMIASKPHKRYQHPQQAAEALAAFLPAEQRTETVRLAASPPAAAATKVAPAERRAVVDFLMPEVKPRARAPVPAKEPPIDFPVGPMLPDDGGLFDTSMVTTVRHSRGSSNRNLPVLTIVLAIVLLVGVLTAGIALLKSGNTAAGGTAAGESIPAKSEKPVAPLDNAKTSEAKAADKSRAPEASEGAQGGSENAEEGAQERASKKIESEVVLVQATTDAGKALWKSPTGGPPVSLEYVAPGAQVFLILRPADLVRTAEGPKVLAALGPFGAAEQQVLETTCGAPLNTVEQLIVTWVERMTEKGASNIVPMYVFRFAAPIDQNKLLGQWNNPAPVLQGSEKVYSTPTGAVYFPEGEAGKVLVAGAQEEVDESARQGTASPLLRREIEEMLAATDAQRQATLLFSPNYLFQESPYFFRGELKPLLEPMRAFLGIDCRAVLISGQLTNENCFLELRVLGPLGRWPDSIAQQFQERLAKLPAMLEANLAGFEPQAYSKQILLRFPQMIRALEEFTRAGKSGNQAVLRSYLPAPAAHNLLMGSELALAEEASARPASGVAAGSGSNGPESIQQKLQHVTSLVIARDTLERAVQLLADDIQVKAEILGPDLQLDGITKNQSFGIEENNETAGEILRKIMLKANPEGKLVYVIKAREPGGEQMLLITTRAAAKKRGDTLPAELIQPKPK